jgi:hypothetical protein
MHCRITSGTFVAALFAVSMICSRARAEDADPPPWYPPQSEVRSGGVLEESYNYHRQPTRMAAASPCIEPASGWYGYGFPVQTFRWGWFGAAHYYPTVWWHEGYYGDCCRCAYRRGY